MTLLTNCVGYWKLDENTGTTAADATGNNPQSTITGISSWTTGKINSGTASTSGTTSGSQSGSPLDFAGAVSMSGWIKPASSGTQSIICRGTSGSGRCYAVGVGGTSQVLVALGNGGYAAFVTISSPWTVGSWNHIAVTADGTNIKVYVNGSLGATVANTTVSATQLCQTLIGNDVFGNATTGPIDEIGVWSRALTSTEVSQLYNSGAGLQYPFSGGGSTASLFRQTLLNGIGSGGPFFNNPIGRSMLGCRPKLVTA